MGHYFKDSRFGYPATIFGQTKNCNVIAQVSWISRGKILRKSLHGLVAIAALILAAPVGAARAADMPLKAPPPAAPAYDPWAGFYSGASAGARFADVQWDSISYFPGAPVVITPSSFNNPAGMNSTSARLGGYLGYNWRIAPSWLAGFEGDIAWANSSKTLTPFPGGSNQGTVAGLDFVTAKVGWDASARGRVGILLNPSWLLYGTGGVAWQEIKTVSACAPGGYCAIAVSGTSSTDKAGWTVGGGLETALANHWLVRAEYRYADFGHVTNILPPAAFAGLTSSIPVKTNTGLLGLAYKW
jgi:outer membrane immunogenic protein